MSASRFVSLGGSPTIHFHSSCSNDSLASCRGTSTYSRLPYRPYSNLILSLHVSASRFASLGVAFQHYLNISFVKCYGLYLYRTRHIKAAVVHAEDISRQFSVMSGTSACSCLPYRPYFNLILTLHVSASRFASLRSLTIQSGGKKTSIPFIGLSCGCVHVRVSGFEVLLRVAVVCCQRLQEIKIC